MIHVRLGNHRSHRGVRIARFKLATAMSLPKCDQVSRCHMRLLPRILEQKHSWVDGFTSGSPLLESSRQEQLEPSLPRAWEHDTVAATLMRGTRTKVEKL